MAKSTRKAQANRRRIAKADERVVKATDRAVPVAPSRRGRTPDHPTHPAAVDHRKQFTGTDEPARRER